MRTFLQRLTIAASLGIISVNAFGQQRSAPRGTSVDINPNGETRLETKLLGKTVVIKFETHATPMPPVTKDFPFDYTSNCTASSNPCVLIENLRIEVNGEDIGVPRSAYADCSDLLWASLTGKGTLYSLLLRGGDASEAYDATIRFTPSRVLERTVVSDENRPYVEERTRYYVTPPLN